MRQASNSKEEESRDQRLTRWLFEKVWIPWVQRLRKQVDPEFNDGDDPPPYLKVAWWFDGAIPPLKAVTHAQLMAKLVQLGFILNKGNPGRTGVEQLLDVIDAFKR